MQSLERRIGFGPAPLDHAAVSNEWENRVDSKLDRSNDHVVESVLGDQGRRDRDTRHNRGLAELFSDRHNREDSVFDAANFVAPPIATTIGKCDDFTTS